jgi:hypothetical protein
VSAQSFIRAAELWLPSADFGVLDYRGGLYGLGSQMARVSADMCFGRAEGLPGRAWDDAVPVVLKSLTGSYFRRGDAAVADGLSVGIALPFFDGGRIRAVAVLYGGEDDEHAGAVELWHNDPAQGKDMTLAEGFYGQTAETFEYVSRRTSFRRGTGLPGLAWQQHAPVVLPDLGRGSGFLRSDSAVKVGINRGLAFPCATPGAGTWVLAFLSALGTPIAQRVEVWRPGPAGAPPVLGSGCCETEGLLADGSENLPAVPGCILDCWTSGLPTLTRALAEQPNRGARQPGLSSMLVLPVLEGGAVKATVALYL